MTIKWKKNKTFFYIQGQEKSERGKLRKITYETTIHGQFCYNRLHTSPFWPAMSWETQRMQLLCFFWTTETSTESLATLELSFVCAYDACNHSSSLLCSLGSPGLRDNSISSRDRPFVSTMKYMAKTAAKSETPPKAAYTTATPNRSTNSRKYKPTRKLQTWNWVIFQYTYQWKRVPGIDQHKFAYTSIQFTTSLVAPLFIGISCLSFFFFLWLLMFIWSRWLYRTKYKVGFFTSKVHVSCNLRITN